MVLVVNVGDGRALFMAVVMLYVVVLFLHEGASEFMVLLQVII